ncbi:hypothetical protein A5698_06240 [Mycobacterium sp. E136]|nr:hypothetical protein A5698_06240 [Mycobacterium sp. E136]
MVASAVLTPASARHSATSLAAAAFELAGTTRADGRCSASQLRTCAAATGKAAMVATSSTAVPSRTAIVNDTSSVSSAKICSGVPVASPSSVGSTEPSIEFSIGTQA